MRPIGYGIIVLALLGGCSIPPAEKSAREQALKGVADSFIQYVIQDNWAGAFGLTEAGLQGPDDLKDFLKKSWVQDGVLTGGIISSMAWVTDDSAKVKINWSFQTGTVPSFSSETYVWQWKDKAWKFKGRVIR